MSAADPLENAFSQLREATSIVAPPPNFAKLWLEVEARRQTRLEAIASWSTAATVAGLWLAALLALLAGSSLHAAIGLAAAAIWLASDNAIVAPLMPGRREPA